MATLTLKIRNYRAIPYRKPLEFEIGKGITFFLGPNNVGKSSLLRLFFELRPVFDVITKSDRLKKAFDAVDRRQVANGHEPVAVGLSVLADELFNQQSIERQLEIQATAAGAEVRIEIAQKADQNQKQYTVTIAVSRGPRATQEEVFSELRALFVDSLLIPSLRPMTLRTHDPKIKDVIVSASLISRIGQWQTGHTLAHKKEFAELEAELGELFSASNFRIFVSHGSGNLQIQIDGQFFNIEDLGDGLSHFILALSNTLFEKPTYVLIDEPEIGLHSRLQQTFVRALAAKASRGLIAATHSIGLARSTGDRIYTVQKDSAGMSVRAFGDNSRYSPHITDSLHELGYSQFVELGGDCILLVEGHTDIKAFREILRKFKAEQKVIIWHLGGSGFLASGDVIQELSEIKRLEAIS